MYRFIFCSFQNIFIHWAIYSFLCAVLCVLCLMFHPHSCLHNRLTCRLTFSICSSTELNHDFWCVIPAALFVPTMIYYHTPCLMWGQSVEGVLPDLFWTQSKHNVLFSFFFSQFFCVFVFSQHSEDNVAGLTYISFYHTPPCPRPKCLHWTLHFQSSRSETPVSAYSYRLRFPALFHMLNLYTC